MLILNNEPMFKHTTMKVGGAADLFIQVADEDELKAALRFAKTMPVMILGNGSNIIFTDKGFRGCIIHLMTNKIHHENDLLYCDAGVMIEDAILYCILNKLKGIECLTGIPGTIGGAVCMNAGYTKEISTLIHRVRVIDFQGKYYEFNQDELAFGFRKSIFQCKQYIIVEAVMKMQSGDIHAEVMELTERRKKTQPVSYASSGTIFKGNGLKAFQGLKCGLAEVRKSYIINHGWNNAQDVINLIRTIQGKIDAQLEVEIIGEE